MNYGWTGENWDALGRLEVDLSDYVKADDIEPLSTVDLDVIMKSASTIDSFKALVNAGGEFTLSENLDFDEVIEIPAGKAVTINLDGCNITSTASTVFNVNGGSLVLDGNGEVTGPRNIGDAINGGNITINGGDYTSTGYLGFTATGENSKVTINNGSVTAREGAVMAFSGAAL